MRRRWRRCLQERERMAGKRVGLVISGGNIDLELFGRWVLREGGGQS